MSSEEIGRPENFGEIILKSLKQLPKDCVLVHLGDFCIGNDELHHKAFMDILDCRKVLVRGNHDKKSNTWYLEHGWDFVCESFYDTVCGQKIVFTHAPIGWDGVAAMNIHGHLHNCSHRDIKTLSFNRLLALELHGYKPQPLEKFISIKK